MLNSHADLESSFLHVNKIFTSLLGAGDGVKKNIRCNKCDDYLLYMVFHQGHLHLSTFAFRMNVRAKVQSCEHEGAKVQRQRSNSAIAAFATMHSHFRNFTILPSPFFNVSRSLYHLKIIIAI